MNKEAFNQPASFLRPDLSLYLERLATVTANLSALSASPASGKPDKPPIENDPPPPAPEASVTRIYDVSVQGSDLDFDAAFVGVPLGQAAGRAAYWIHPDNMAEAEVLLLRHLKHRIPNAQGSNASSTRIHLAMFDNLQRYVQQQGTTTVGQTEDMEGSIASNAALNILWSEEAQAIVVASDPSPVSTERKRLHSRTIPVSRINLPRCLSRQGLAKESSNTQGINGKLKPTQHGASELRDYLSQHRDVKPLAEVHLTRERFVGIRNSREVGTWAVLDRDITMSPVDVSALGGTSKDASDGEYAIESPEGRAFPYAVLQFRWEFSRTPEIVRAFDTTHLAERVRGFNMETEAIYTICSPEEMPQPLWQPLLARDIRKVPPAQPRRTSRRNKNGSTSIETSLPISSGPSSTEGPSDSIFSSAQGQSSATSILDSGATTAESTSPEFNKEAFENQGLPKQKRHPRPPTIRQQKPINRYWNEFDDGDEFAEESSYAIYVTPDEPMKLPGAEVVSKAFATMCMSLSKGSQRIASWLPLSSTHSEEGERRPLLGGQRRSTDLEDSSDSDTITTTTRKGAGRQKGGVGAGSRITSDGTIRQRRFRESRESNIFRTYVASFLVAYGLLVLSGILRMTGRHKAGLEVDTGVILGAVGALCCGIGGVSLMVTRKEQLSILHRAAVLLAFCIVCAGSGYLLALVGTSG